MAKFQCPSIHGVEVVEASFKGALATDKGFSFAALDIHFPGRSDTDHADYINVYLPANRADYARDLVEAINSVAKGRRMPASDLTDAATKALNYIENTESELGITLSCGDALRAALAMPTLMAAE